VPSQVLYINSGIASAGDGTRGNPRSAERTSPTAMIAPHDRAAGDEKSSAWRQRLWANLERRTRLIAAVDHHAIAWPAANTALNGNKPSVRRPVWTVVGPATSARSGHAGQMGAETRSQANQVFVLGLGVESANLGYSFRIRRWEQFLPPMAAVDLATRTAGCCGHAGRLALCASAGRNYPALTDAYPSRHLIAWYCAYPLTSWLSRAPLR